MKTSILWQDIPKNPRQFHHNGVYLVVLCDSNEVAMDLVGVEWYKENCPLALADAKG